MADYPANPDVAPHPAARPGRGSLAAALVLVALALGGVMLAADIPPPVADDNAYTFLAADRLFGGHGLTSIPPHAPLQPWQWHADWAVLTQWPPGYPVLICLVRWLTGLATVNAARLIAVLACAAALVGWFAWARQVVNAAPPARSRRPTAGRSRGGLAAAMLAMLAALAAVGAPHLVNPSSDTVLIAAVPWCLLLALRFDGTPRRGILRFAVLGVVCGMLFWIRYAALFVPLAIGVFLLVRLAGGRRRIGDVASFVLGVAIPLAGLVAFNHGAARATSVTASFNLGSQVEARFAPVYIQEAWHQFTGQSLYTHRPLSAPFFAWGLPLIAITVPLASRRLRKRWLAWVRSPGVLLSLSATITLLAFLILATTFFSGKFNYVGLSRYYQPVRPLYFVLLVGSLLCIRNPLVRACLCIGLLAGCSWFIRQDAARDLRRWQTANRPTTEYGRWATRFEPGSRALYAWIRTQATNRWILFSNFHDDIALETHVPACPLPRDRNEMESWLAAARTARGQTDLEVLFVLDPDNHHRTYYLPPAADVVAEFRLEAAHSVPEAVRNYVFRPAGEALAAGH